MSRKLHLFNPENDLALAHGAANFTPPRVVREFHRAGALLPVWYAAPGDLIVADPSIRGWLRAVRDDVDILDGAVPSGDEIEPAPWGWSANAVRQFESCGVTVHPPVEPIVRLSHRRTAARLLTAIAGTVDYELPPVPREITSVDCLPDLSAGFFMKAPWSGSGRGVLDCSLLPERQIRFQAEGIIRRQGSVMIEPKLDKVTDFAMLFYSTPDGMVHAGYSLFFNSVANAYGGNVVASQQEIFDRIAAVGCGSKRLSDTAAAVTEALGRIIPGNEYCGPLGVDMMIYRSVSGEMLIAPAVEVNVRMTMGFVALRLYERMGRCGVMSVGYGVVPPAESMPMIPSGSPFSIVFTPNAG